MAPLLFPESIVGVIDGFRWAICRGASPFFWRGFALSVLIVTLFLDIWYFRRMERTFADVI
jgi:lipopolysaccharide transport system permease protein